MMGTLWQTQRRSAACGLLSGVFLVTAVVLSRRISGDASAFSSELAACLTGVAASVIATLAASMPELISDRLTRPLRWLLTSVCGIPGVMLGLALMPPGSTTGLACLLGLYVAAVLTLSISESDGAGGLTESIVRLRAKQATDGDQSSGIVADSDRIADSEARSAQTGATPFETQTMDERLSLPATDSAVDARSDEPAGHHETEEPTAALPFELNEPMPHPASNPDTTQWMSRSRVEGLDVAEGAFRVHFTAGQRLAPVHLPFSPPLADTPEFECEPADESDLRFRTTAVHAYGVRIEVSRSGDCNDEATVEVAWMASAALSDSAAA
jgi:hypothetical protein